MKLNDFLSALKTTGIKVTLVNVEGEEIIKFFSEGYTGIESDILARTIKRFDITSANSISVVLNNPVETEPETESDTNSSQQYTGD